LSNLLSEMYNLSYAVLVGAVRTTTAYSSCEAGSPRSRQIPECAKASKHRLILSRSSPFLIAAVHALRF